MAHFSRKLWERSDDHSPDRHAHVYRFDHSTTSRFECDTIKSEPLSIACVRRQPAKPTILPERAAISLSDTNQIYANTGEFL
jgi:hypothetical protein